MIQNAKRMRKVDVNVYDIQQYSMRLTSVNTRQFFSYKRSLEGYEQQLLLVTMKSDYFRFTGT